MRIKSVFTVMFLCMLFTKICSAALYHDEKNGITYDLNHSSNGFREYASSELGCPDYSFAIVDNKKTVCAKAWHASTYVSASEELPAKKAMLHFLEKYRNADADIVIFLVRDDVFSDSQEIVCDIYIKAKKNDSNDFCTLSDRKFNAVKNKYIYDMKTLYEDVEEYESGRNILKRDNTIQLTAFNKKDKNIVLKRVVSRYGKIVELTGYFKHYGNKSIKYFKKLGAINTYFDEICKHIDFDNSMYIDEKTQEYYWFSL